MTVSPPGFVESPWRSGQALERPLRLATGLIILAFVLCHFANHALGLWSLEAMQHGSAWLIVPWHYLPGSALLYGSLLIHALLGLVALYRRRHMRMPVADIFQLSLGLAIPVLLIVHVATLRIGGDHFGIEFTQTRVLYEFFMVSPFYALPRQLLLLIVVWAHGCLGVRAWLRWRPWFPRWSGMLIGAATLVPALAILGVAIAGVKLRLAVAEDVALAKALADAVARDAESAALLSAIVGLLTFGYAVVVAGVIGLRYGRGWLSRRHDAIGITYPGSHVVWVPRGYSLLEASRWAGIPHASVCGGRARCSTCRVRIVSLAHDEAIPPPGPIEQQTLARIGAAPHVRLACQTRPAGNLTIQLLVPPGRSAATQDGERFRAAVEGGREIETAAMFIDMRGSTRLASGRLPYDALFLFDRYIQTVTRAIRAQGGHTTSIAGDGVMSVFGVEVDVAKAARSALAAARDIWVGIDQLNAELEGELEEPLRIGIGIHVGLSVIGLVSTGETQTLQFLGDTGNTAAKLEARTKDLGCTLIASLDTLEKAVPGGTAPAAEDVQVAGKSEPIPAVAFSDVAQLQALLEG